MSRKLVVLLCAAIATGCAGAGGASPALSAQELREGCVATTLDVLLGAVDLVGGNLEPGVFEVDANVGGEPVTLLVTVTADGDAFHVTVETSGAEASLVLTEDEDLGISVSGTLLLGSPDGCTVEGTLDRVFVRPVADLPDVGSGALFTQGNVDLGVHAGEELLATGTAALYGRRALVGLSVGGAFTEGEVALGQ